MSRAVGVSVDSATGVEVALPVAGPGARAFAFLVDWHIRVILCIAWYVLAAILYNRGAGLTPPLSPGAAWFVFVITPGALLYFLYHPLLEVGMGGRTPGKRMAGLRIVTLSGEVPGIGPLVARNIFRLVDSFPLAYAVGLTSTILTRHHVRIGDLAAGTLLIYVHGDARLPLGAQATAASAAGLAPARMEIAGELLQRWTEIEPAARCRLARELLQAAAHRHDSAPLRDPAMLAAQGPVDDDALRSQLERLVGS